MRFIVRQKFFSIRDGFYIKDEAGRDMYHVQGKLFSLGKKLYLRDLAGNELFIKQRLFRLRARYDFLINDEVVAVVKRRWFPLFLKRYKVESDVFGDLKIKGNIMAWSFSIDTKDGHSLATVSKKILHINDTYAVDIFDKRFEMLGLGIAVMLDAVHHKGR